MTLWANRAGSDSERLFRLDTALCLVWLMAGHRCCVKVTLTQTNRQGSLDR